MLEELRWRTSMSATCLHAAACRAAGVAAADQAVADILDGPNEALTAEIEAAGWPVAAVLAELTALAAEIDNNRDLAARAQQKLRLPPVDAATAVRIAGAIADLEAAMMRTRPELAEELAMRVRPLREQWEARGPGMLGEIVRLTDELVIPSAAEIVLVVPYAGGAGVAHSTYNRVTLEAVLYDPDPMLPETVRLAWLIAQLNSDLPRMHDLIPARRAVAAVQLAVVPPVLQAAEAVELVHFDERALTGALAAWRVVAGDPEQTATKLSSWWNAWLDQPTTWPVAVAALDQMLA